MNLQSDKGKCWSCRAAKEPEWISCPFCGTRFSETRNPAASMPELDMKFLKDIYSFSWYNHQVAAVALYEAVATIHHFYGDNVQERFDLVVEPQRAQKILRAKIFAENMGQHEAFGMLCLAVEKRKEQSMLWTYLNTEPNEVTQFFQRVLDFPKPPSLQRLLNLPRISDIRKAISSGLATDHPDIAEGAQKLIEACLYDYTEHSDNFVRIAQSYLRNDKANVRIYNKIKHGFAVVEGQDWFIPPLDPYKVAVITNANGEVAILNMDQAEVDREMDNVRLLMITCAEIMALCAKFVELGILYK